MNDQEHLGQQAHWDELHARYSGPEHNAKLPGAFAQYFGGYLAAQGLHGPLLELGCGGGADYNYFSNMGIKAVGLDFSRSALTTAKKRLGNEVQLLQHNLAQGLPFADETFSAVFAHLCLHYFDDETTAFIFSEIHHVLGLNGLFALRVKSVENELYGQGELIATDMYYYRGHVRHFFRQEFLNLLIAQNPWHLINQGNKLQEPGYLSAILQKKE